MSSNDRIVRVLRGAELRILRLLKRRQTPESKTAYRTAARLIRRVRIA